MSNNTVDFSFKQYRRSYLFLKKPSGSQIPEGWTWTCPCGRTNELQNVPEQYCPVCGSRLRIHDHRQEDDREGHDGAGLSFTVVRVSHFTVRPPKA